jgi:hypothetical protein
VGGGRMVMEETLQASKGEKCHEEVTFEMILDWLPDCQIGLKRAAFQMVWPELIKYDAWLWGKNVQYSFLHRREVRFQRLLRALLSRAWMSRERVWIPFFHYHYCLSFLTQKPQNNDSIDGWQGVTDQKMHSVWRDLIFQMATLMTASRCSHRL